MDDKYIVYFISRTKQKMILFIQQQLKNEELSNIVPSHGNILTALYENNGKLSLQEIAKKIGKDKSTVTSLVKKLTSLGYVEKITSKEDKRVSYLHLTEKGKSIECVFNKISDNVQKTAYQNFTLEEKETFLRLLKKLNQNFDTNKQV